MRRLAIIAAVATAAVSIPQSANAEFVLLLERDADSTTNEVFIQSYASFADLISNTGGTGAFSQLNLSSAFSVGGFTYDGSLYHLLLERDVDSTTNEVFIQSYASFADLISNTGGTGVFSQLNLSSAFSVGGFTYDGSLYHLLLERDVDSTTNEIFIQSYASLSDLISNTGGTGVFSQLNLSSAFSVGGFAFTGTFSDPGGNAIPEPSTWVSMLLGFGIAGGLLRRGRRGRDRQLQRHQARAT